MLIVADENIPLLDAFLKDLARFAAFPAAPSTVPPSSTRMCCWCAR